MNRIFQYWRFLVANGGVRRHHAVLILALGAGAVFSEAVGLTMMLPVIEYIDMGGDLSALETKNAIWTSLIAVAAFIGADLNLGFMAAFIVAAVVFRQSFDYFHAVILATVTAEIQRRLRLSAYDRFQASQLGFVHRVGSGPFLNLLDRQAEGAALLLTNGANFAKYTLTFVVYAGVMVAAAPLSSIASIVMMAFLVLIVQRYVRRTRELSLAMIDFRSAYTGFIGESFRAARTVRIFGLHEAQDKQLNRLTLRYSDLLINLARMAARIPLIIAPLIAAAVMGYLYVTFTYLDMTTSAITLFALILMRLAPSAQNFAKQQQTFVQFGANLEALETFGDDAEQDRDGSGGTATPGRLETSVTFKDVTFTYPGAERPSLSHVSVDLKVGRVIAIKGPSGAGKSTFVDLLPALIQPDSGKILYDGTPLDSFNNQALRGFISYAAQEAFLFSGTVRDNIRLSRPGADNAEIEAACKAAYAHEFVVNLPGGYDADLGEAGSKLSGGQKQRLALARCFLRDASILIVDEPTSALDPTSEDMVRRAIRNYVDNHGALALVIAHRDTTVENADEIIELEDGRITRYEHHLKTLEDSSKLPETVNT